MYAQFSDQVSEKRFSGEWYKMTWMNYLKKINIISIHIIIYQALILCQDRSR